VDPRAGWDGCGKSRPHWDTLPVPSVYTEYVIPAHRGKAISVQAYCSPKGFQNFGAPTFLENRHKKVVVCQPCTPAAFTPKKYSCYSCLLEAESTPEPATKEKIVTYQNMCP